jgi:hypothetical protein
MIVKATGPCPHGVINGVCWRCTRNKIGIVSTVVEWVKWRYFVLRWRVYRFNCD